MAAITLKSWRTPPFSPCTMIDVGIAGPIGMTLAWLCALLLAAVAVTSGRVAWAISVRGARRGAYKVVTMLSLMAVALVLSVIQFAQTPQSVTIAKDGSWSVYNAYQVRIEHIPADEPRQIRLTKALDRQPTRLELRRDDGRVLVFYGPHLTQRLGYALNECGAWAERPIWHPHAYGPNGPDCPDEPWPAAMRSAPNHGTVAAR